MAEGDGLTEQFEANRGHLRAVAYRMLGSRAEAEDAVQEAWLRLSRADTSEVENRAGWLTTVVARVSLDMLHSRKSRREKAMGEHKPEAVERDAKVGSPEYDVEMADAVGPALLVVLDTLAPAERLAFVLHDLFGVPFDEIAVILGRSSDAARQLASRARRRVRGAAPVQEADLERQREVVNAFLRASRGGDFEALLTVLDPEVVVRADATSVKMGADAKVQGRRWSSIPSWVDRLARSRQSSTAWPEQPGRRVVRFGPSSALRWWMGKSPRSTWSPTGSGSTS